MNKKEVIEKIEKLKGLTIKEKNLILDIEMISKGDVLEIISQIDESQKVVVPQFVADWLEVCKENLGFGLSNAMSHSTSAMNKQPNWVKRWFNFKDNQETFAKAWLFGYETKKDKLYQVELPGSHKEGDIILVKDDNGDITYDVVFSDRWKERDYTKLTEDEIKRDHSWAWPFAKEVEE